MMAALLAILGIACVSLESLPVLTDRATDGGALRVAAGLIFALLFLLIGPGAQAWERRNASEIRVLDDGCIPLVCGHGECAMGRS